MTPDVLSTDTALDILLRYQVQDPATAQSIKIRDVIARATPNDGSLIYNKILARFGMRVFANTDGTYLFFGNSPDTDMRLVFPTGAYRNGAWKQSFMRLRGARTTGLKTIAGNTMRGIEVPMSTVLDSTKP